GTGLGLSIALEDARLHGGWLQAWGEPGGGSQFRLTLPRTADEPLRGSPIALEPKDSRRNRGLDDAGLPRGGDGEKRATVPVQPPQAAGQAQAARDPLVPRTAAEPPTADPTALPGNGARVVSRPAPAARRPDGQPEQPDTPTDPGPGTPTGPGPHGPAAGPDDRPAPGPRRAATRHSARSTARDTAAAPDGTREDGDGHGNDDDGDRARTRDEEASRGRRSARAARPADDEAGDGVHRGGRRPAGRLRVAAGQRRPAGRGGHTPPPRPGPGVPHAAERQS